MEYFFAFFDDNTLAEEVALDGEHLRAAEDIAVLVCEYGLQPEIAVVRRFLRYGGGVA